VRAVLARPDGDLAFEELGGSAVLQNLYALKNQTTRREAELATHFGERHPQILNVQAERHELERRIQAEQRALLGAVEAEIEAARAREATLLRELDGLKAQSQAQGEAGARIADLDRAVDRARRQHEAYLARYQTITDVIETQHADRLGRSPRPTPAAAALLPQAGPPFRPLLRGLAHDRDLPSSSWSSKDRGFRTQRAAELGLGGAASAACRSSARAAAMREPRRPCRWMQPRSRFAEALRALVTELGSRG
jgi:hypothetical protein